MREFIYLVVLTASAVSVSGNLSFKQGRSSLVSVSDGQCDKIYSCLDCKTTRLCRPDGKGGFIQIETVPCPISTPFCNYETGTCSHVPDKTCGAKDSFTCLADGYYPDVNCKTYHICTGLTASKFQCTVPEENYNPIERNCDPEQKCGTFTCEGAGKKVPHDESPNFYAYCDGKSVALVDRCPGKYELVESQQLCTPVCHQEGVMEDLEDCTRYYKCKKIWFGVLFFMRRTREYCPPETAFDPGNFICVSLDRHPNPSCADRPTPTTVPTSPTQPTPTTVPPSSTPSTPTAEPPSPTPTTVPPSPTPTTVPPSPTQSTPTTVLLPSSLQPPSSSPERPTPTSKPLTPTSVPTLPSSPFPSKATTVEPSHPASSPTEPAPSPSVSPAITQTTISPPPSLSPTAVPTPTSGSPSSAPLI